MTSGASLPSPGTFVIDKWPCLLWYWPKQDVNGAYFYSICLGLERKRQLFLGSLLSSIDLHLENLASDLAICHTISHDRSEVELCLWSLFQYAAMSRQSAAISLTPAIVYTYSSRLEFGSPRFSTPGSFLVYVIFIGSVIMVSLRYSSLKYIYQNNRTLPTTIFSTSLHPTLPSPSQNLAYLPAQPSSSWSGSWKRGRSPLHRIWYLSFDPYRAMYVWEWWDCLLR
jgi:hypothetical protein